MEVYLKYGLDKDNGTRCLDWRDDRYSQSWLEHLHQDHSESSEVGGGDTIAVNQEQFGITLTESHLA
jgi:hypothetical protein